jgi:hypothetical protein
MADQWKPPSRPLAPAPLPVRETVEETVTKFGRWLEGYTDEAGTPHPGSS